VVVQVFGFPELSGDFLIDSQGNIALPIGGSVSAAEVTPAQLEQRITDTLADGYILQPRVSVRPGEWRPIYVMGDVRAGGAIPFRLGMTALAAIAMAGGPAAADPETSAFRGDLVDAEERLDLLEVQRRGLQSRIARLEAQRDGLPNPAFPEAPGAAAQRVIADERAIFESEREAEQRQVALLNQQIKNAESEVTSLAEQLRLERQQLQTAQSYAQELAQLARAGLTDRRRLVEAQRDVARIEANIARLGTDTARASQVLREAPLRLSEVRGSGQQRALLGLQESRARLAETETGIAASRQQIVLRRQRIGNVAANWAGEQTRLLLSRTEAGQVRTFDAEEATVLRPGDILRVTGSASLRVSGTRPVAADTRRP